MKGMVFAEFLDMVEDQFSLEMADEIIEASNLPSGGAYTAIGTYDHAEMVQLVVQLSERSDIPVPDLLRAFGHHLLPRLVAGHAQFMEGHATAFDFLRVLEDHIHVEVKKLYPDAELPHFEMADAPANQLDMTYNSARPFADFAHGLLMGVIEHFAEEIDIARQDIARGGDAPDGRTARFVLTRKE